MLYTYRPSELFSKSFPGSPVFMALAGVVLRLSTQGRRIVPDVWEGIWQTQSIQTTTWKKSRY